VDRRYEIASGYKQGLNLSAVQYCGLEEFQVFTLRADGKLIADPESAGTHNASTEPSVTEHCRYATAAQGLLHT
jgi:hypothetical protein